MSESSPVKSVCVFCGSSNAADPAFIAAAGAFGKLLGEAGLRLVYGGGGIGLMGAVASGCFKAGGKVLGVMPEFLQQRERLFEEVETVIVPSMHERKMMMFEQSDAFVILPGGVGTLEEVIELMSWRRLSLHDKPIVFFDQGGYWKPLYALIEHTVAHRLTPVEFLDTYRSVEDLAQIIPTIHAMAAEEARPIGLMI